jgi:hypothetical protein
MFSHAENFLVDTMAWGHSSFACDAQAWHSVGAASTAECVHVLRAIEESGPRPFDSPTPES